MATQCVTRDDIKLVVWWPSSGLTRGHYSAWEKREVTNSHQKGLLWTELVALSFRGTQTQDAVRRVLESEVPLESHRLIRAQDDQDDSSRLSASQSALTHTALFSVLNVLFHFKIPGSYEVNKTFINYESYHHPPSFYTNDLGMRNRKNTQQFAAHKRVFNYISTDTNPPKSLSADQA